MNDPIIYGTRGTARFSEIRELYPPVKLIPAIIMDAWLDRSEGLELTIDIFNGNNPMITGLFNMEGEDHILNFLDYIELDEMKEFKGLELRAIYSGDDIYGITRGDLK